MSVSTQHAVSTAPEERVEKEGNRIDIVYLWVDGADPEWQQKWRHSYASRAWLHAGELAPHGNTRSRYRNNGELRFSLRALEKLFP